MEELPIIEPDASQSDAMQAIGAAGAAAGAVRLDEGFAVLSANAILATDTDEERVGAIARREGITIPDDAVNLGGTSISIKPNRMTLPSFDAPAGYKQCQVNGNHTFPLDYGQNVCWHDNGQLRTIYLGD